MFIDERIYTLHAGQVPVFLKLYEEEGMECQVRILGKMVGYYFTERRPAESDRTYVGIRKS